MRFLDRAERKFGRFGIHDLIIYIIAGNALVWLVDFVFSGSPLGNWLYLLPSRVFRGEVWRIFSFVFLSTFKSNVIYALLELYFLFMIGRNLEYHFGSFKFTFYYLGGVLLTAAASLLTGFRVDSPSFIHLSLFFAFASIAPDFRVLLFFFIPVKIKWMAWLSALVMGYQFVTTPYWQFRLIILAPVLIYFLFFGHGILQMFRNNRRVHMNRMEFQRKKDGRPADAVWGGGSKRSGQKRRKFGVLKGGGAAKSGSDTESGSNSTSSSVRMSGGSAIRVSFHRCEVCGITELDSSETEFRYCSKCVGNHEYCMEHLTTHEHICE